MSNTSVVMTDYNSMHQWVQYLFDGITSADRVFIKPNLCIDLPASTGVTTDLEIVAFLVQELNEIGVKKIYVGENPIHKSEEILNNLNFYSLKKYGASVINLDNDENVIVNNELFGSFKRFHLPKTLLDADVVISVPKMKTHCETGASLGLKNLFGFLPRGDRALAHKGNIHEAIVSIFHFLQKEKRLLSVVDGIVALEGKNGPTVGNPVHIGLIVMGKDIVAVDSTCIRVMGANPEDIPHIKLAATHGLGSLENIRILGKGIEEVKRNFVFPDLKKLRGGSLRAKLHEKLFKKYPYMASRNKCTLCMGCVNICPTESVSLNSRREIVFNYDKCISCLCCCEVCKAGSLDYKMKNETIYSGLRNLKKTVIKTIRAGQKG